MQKYEREIEDLLEKLEEEFEHRPKPPRRDRPPQLPRRKPPLLPVRAALPRFGNPSSGQWMAAGIALVVLSMVLPRSIGGLAQWLAVVGVVLFLWPLVYGLATGGRTSREEKLWRGRSLEPEETSWSDIRSRVETSARDFRRRFNRRRY